jgi:cell division protease FtsH
VNEAALLSARRSHKQIESQDLENAVDRVIAGPERRSRLITPEERRIIAYHEAGHALVAHVLPHSHPVHKISIIPRGRALGYTLTLPTEDRYLVTKAELTDELAVMLGGRAAEELVFGDVTTGAQDDIDRCTKIARQMVCEYGLSSLGHMALGPNQDAPFVGRDVGSSEYSDRVADEIDAEIHRLIDGAFERAKELLRTHRETLDGIVERLMEKETIEAHELEEVFAGVTAKKAERGRILEEASSPEVSKTKGRKRRQTQPKPKPGLSPA